MFLPADHIGLLLYLLVTSFITFLVGDYSSNLIYFTSCLAIYNSPKSDVAIYAISAILLYYVISFLYQLVPWLVSRSRADLSARQHFTPTVSPEPLRPLVFPCRTTHTRLFPKKHNLSYTYLQVGIPIGWQGHSSILGFDDSNSRPWFSIRAADYLARDQETSSLKDKLEAYLSSQGENLKDYAHAYLITAPRFLGYAFNPVSFWYLFSSNLRLEAMILEVNNTFDERRIYFMKQSGNIDGDTPEGAKFTHTWPKDFHVSPFNSRKGDYSLAAINPFTSSKDSSPKIDNVITLKSSKGHAKIVARIFSTDSAVDPADMSALDTTRLLSRWFWTGFLTFPRILKEAAILFFKHKLHVWYRPEVARTSIGRQSSKRERFIESIFQSFLREQIFHSANPVSLTYIAPTGSTADALHLVSEQNTDKSPSQELTFQILTPQLYTSIFTGDPASYISASKTKPIELQTFTTTSHQDLEKLFTKTTHLTRNPTVSITTFTRAYILSILRWRSKDTHILDEWVIYSTSLTNQEKNAYFKCVTTLILAERAFAGFDNVLDRIVQAMQIALIWKLTRLITKS